MSTTGDAPSARLAHTATSIFDAVYVFGGRCGKEMGEGALSDLFRLDPAVGDWKTITDARGPAPPARSFHASVAVDSLLFVFGGCGEEGRLSDLYDFDTQSHTWRQLPTPPGAAGRGGASLAASVDGRSLFLLGGFCGKELDEVLRYDLAAGKWESMASLPVARSVFGSAAHACKQSPAACEHAGHLLVFGGEVDPSDKGHEGAGDFTGETLCFGVGSACSHCHGEAATGHWHSIKTSGDLKPGPRGWYAHTSLNGELLVHGGLDHNNERLDDLWLLRCHAD